ncbi:MAG: 2-C-methyl-D-erythritol 4-phosphate cytidylyltransferase [Phycisphaeraceae bacterium]|nr:2-C-methyl-D-erythritol 4-phosphate cytidylyltransferase [Phycisphaerales bacterium]QOJ19028.1 MAG: 2-C-methyl-D-erythritol 4-phosphate cytidylyltransferase [Phycisphaeraceae bacterium]
MRIVVIIPAAGRSERFAPGTMKNKLEQDLGGRPVFMRSLEALSNRPEISTILVAVNPDSLDEFRMRWGDALGLRGAKVVAGGRLERWETVKNALAHVPDDATHVAVHDGARPCLSDDLITRLFEAAMLFEAVIPGVPVPATLKRVSEQVESAAQDDALASAILGDAGASGTVARTVVETIDRRNVYAIQTPQVFEADLLRRAYAQPDLDSTDDATLVERLGVPVRVIEGDALNIKITTEVDLRLARAILQVKPEKERPAHLRF